MFFGKKSKIDRTEVNMLLKKMGDFQGRIVATLQLYDNTQQADTFPLLYCSLYYFAAIISILKNGNRNTDFMVLRSYMRNTSYTNSKDIALWQAVREYEGIVSEMASEYPKQVVDRGSQISTQFLQEYSFIMSNPLNQSIDGICLTLGHSMLSLCGTDMREINDKTKRLDQILEEFTGFIKYF